MIQALFDRFVRWRRPEPEPEPPLELRGTHILLRPVVLTDSADMYLFVSDPEVTQYLPWHPAPDVYTVKAFLDQQLQRRRRGESLAFSIVLPESGRVIGSTDLMQLKSVAPATAELGYILAKPYWGRGFMSEAAALSRDYAFRYLKRRLLIAYADKENHGSCRVLEKIGMSETGTEWRTVKEQNRLYVRYELTREAWEEQLS